MAKFFTEDSPFQDLIARGPKHRQDYLPSYDMLSEQSYEEVAELAKVHEANQDERGFWKKMGDGAIDMFFRGVVPVAVKLMDIPRILWTDVVGNTIEAVAEPAMSLFGHGLPEEAAKAFGRNLYEIIPDTFGDIFTLDLNTRVDGVNTYHDLMDYLYGPGNYDVDDLSGNKILSTFAGKDVKVSRFLDPFNLSGNNPLKYAAYGGFEIFQDPAAALAPAKDALKGMAKAYIEGSAKQLAKSTGASLKVARKQVVGEMSEFIGLNRAILSHPEASKAAVDMMAAGSTTEANLIGHRIAEAFGIGREAIDAEVKYAANNITSEVEKMMTTPGYENQFGVFFDFHRTFGKVSPRAVHKGIQYVAKARSNYDDIIDMARKALRDGGEKGAKVREYLNGVFPNLDDAGIERLANGVDVNFGDLARNYNVMDLSMEQARRLGDILENPMRIQDVTAGNTTFEEILEASRKYGGDTMFFSNLFDNNPRAFMWSAFQDYKQMVKNPQATLASIRYASNTARALGIGTYASPLWYAKAITHPVKTGKDAVDLVPKMFQAKTYETMWGRTTHDYRDTVKQVMEDQGMGANTASGNWFDKTLGEYMFFGVDAPFSEISEKGMNLTTGAWHMMAANGNSIITRNMDEIKNFIEVELRADPNAFSDMLQMNKQQRAALRLVKEKSFSKVREITKDFASGVATDDILKKHDLDRAEFDALVNSTPDNPKWVEDVRNWYTEVLHLEKSYAIGTQELDDVLGYMPNIISNDFFDYMDTALDSISAFSKRKRTDLRKIIGAKVMERSLKGIPASYINDIMRSGDPEAVKKLLSDLGITKQLEDAYEGGGNAVVKAIENAIDKYAKGYKLPLLVDNPVGQMAARSARHFHDGVMTSVTGLLREHGQIIDFDFGGSTAVLVDRIRKSKYLGDVTVTTAIGEKPLRELSESQLIEVLSDPRQARKILSTRDEGKRLYMLTKEQVAKAEELGYVPLSKHPNKPRYRGADMVMDIAPSDMPAIFGADGRVIYHEGKKARGRVTRVYDVATNKTAVYKRDALRPDKLVKTAIAIERKKRNIARLEKSLELASAQSNDELLWRGTSHSRGTLNDVGYTMWADSADSASAYGKYIWAQKAKDIAWVDSNDFADDMFEYIKMHYLESQEAKELVDAFLDNNPGASIDDAAKAISDEFRAANLPDIIDTAGGYDAHYLMSDFLEVNDKYYGKGVRLGRGAVIFGEGSAKLTDPSAVEVVDVVKAAETEAKLEEQYAALAGMEKELTDAEEALRLRDEKVFDKYAKARNTKLENLRKVREYKREATVERGRKVRQSIKDMRRADRDITRQRRAELLERETYLRNERRAMLKREKQLEREMGPAGSKQAHEYLKAKRATERATKKYEEIQKELKQRYLDEQSVNLVESDYSLPKSGDFEYRPGEGYPIKPKAIRSELSSAKRRYQSRLAKYGKTNPNHRLIVAARNRLDSISELAGRYKSGQTVSYKGRIYNPRAGLEKRLERAAQRVAERTKAADALFDRMEKFDKERLATLEQFRYQRKGLEADIVARAKERGAFTPVTRDYMKEAQAATPMPDRPVLEQVDMPSDIQLQDMTRGERAGRPATQTASQALREVFRGKVSPEEIERLNALMDKVQSADGKSTHSLVITRERLVDLIRRGNGILSDSDIRFLHQKLNESPHGFLDLKTRTTGKGNIDDLARLMDIAAATGTDNAFEAISDEAMHAMAKFNTHLRSASEKVKFLDNKAGRAYQMVFRALSADRLVGTSTLLMNGIGNNIYMMAGGFTANPVSTAKAIWIYSKLRTFRGASRIGVFRKFGEEGLDSVIKGFEPFGTPVTYRQLSDMFDAQGITQGWVRDVGAAFDEGGRAWERQTLELTATGKPSPALAKVWSKIPKAARSVISLPGMAIGLLIDDHMRFIFAYDAIANRGKSLTEAGELTREFMGDFSPLKQTKFDKGVGNFVWFYRFRKWNTVAQMKLMQTDPRWAAFNAKIRRAAAGQMTPDEEFMSTEGAERTDANFMGTVVAKRDDESRTWDREGRLVRSQYAMFNPVGNWFAPADALELGEGMPVVGLLARNTIFSEMDMNRPGTILSIWNGLNALEDMSKIDNPELRREKRLQAQAHFTNTSRILRYIRPLVTDMEEPELAVYDRLMRGPVYKKYVSLQQTLSAARTTAKRGDPEDEQVQRTLIKVSKLFNQLQRVKQYRPESLRPHDFD